MVDLPLPLSPARATISRSPMASDTSSTACRVRRDSVPPTLKCLVSPSVRSSASWGGCAAGGSVAVASVIVGTPVVQQAPDVHAVHRVQLGRVGPAAVHDL